MIGPAWTRDPSLPKPAGTQDMGGWTKAVYTEEQKKAMTQEQRKAIFGSSEPSGAGLFF
jgi:hypothetical protein